MDTPEITQSNRQPGKFGVHFIPKTSFTSIDFILPPSKSHLIRILALASIVEQKTSIIIDGPVGHDVNSMIQCLRTLGVEIISKTSFGRKMLEIQGIGKNAFLPNKTINCGNSGTALRILMNMVSSISGKTMIITSRQ